MDPTRNEASWMSLLDVSRTEERISHLRFALTIFLGFVAVWAFFRNQLVGNAAVAVFVSLCVGAAGPLITLSISRTRNPSRGHEFLNNGVDVLVMTCVLVASLQGDSPSSTLSLSAMFGYVLTVAIAALRLQLFSSLFTAGFASVGAGMVAVYLYVFPRSTAVFSTADLVLVSVLLAGCGGLVTALVLGARSSAATFDEAERIHRCVLNQVSDGLLVCDAMGRIVDVNAAASKVLGLPRGVLVDLNAFNALPAPLASQLEKRWSETFMDGFMLVENLQIGKDEQRVVDVAAYRVRYRGDELVQVVLRDMTAERRLRDHRSDCRRMDSLQKLAGAIAHEFNNMFASIEASSYVLSEAIPKTKPENTEVEIIREATGRAARLVRELRDLTDVRKPHPVPLDVSRVLDRALVAGRGDSAAPVHVSLDVAPTIRHFYGDEGQLVRALANLIGCAYSAMLDGGSLRVSAKNLTIDEVQGDLAAGEYISVCIQDTGIGIPADMVERVFDPFFANDQRRWMGFALANARGVVTRHGGTVNLVSNLGHGSIFTVCLPATERPVMRLATPVTPRVCSEKKIRLLVVDDEPANRNSLARLLSTRGYDVTLAQDGRDAIDTCDRYRGGFDLVLLDLVMPGLSGKDVVVALRARYPTIKVLLITGFADQTLLEEALRLGALSLASKPFDVPELLGQIQELTEGSPVQPSADVMRPPDGTAVV